MSPEILCAIISFAGIVLSSLLSWFISRFTANKELEKLELLWKREDVVSSDDEFAEMAEAVASYCADCRPTTRRIAMEKAAFTRSKEFGDLALCLDLLYVAIMNNQPELADQRLTKVIEEKRKAKSRQQSAKHNKKN